MSVDLSIVPYVYGTVKSKCFLDNVKICVKHRHSCMRKIISYHAWPGKRIWKSAHGAFDFIAKHFGVTRDAWSLKDASTQLLEGMRLLVDDGSCCCCRCGCNFPGVAGLVADAGQCYEMIDAKGALSEAFVLLRRFQTNSASSTVTVKAAKKRVSWFGGRVPPHSGKFRTWDVSQLYRLFSDLSTLLLLGLMFLKFWVSPLEEGLLSKVATTIVLGAQERRWTENAERRNEHGFNPGFPWRQAVCHIRYIDDVILLSKCFCHRCLIDLVNTIYSVPFDCTSENDQLVWLDMIISLKTCATLLLSGGATEVTLKTCFVHVSSLVRHSTFA